MYPPAHLSLKNSFSKQYITQEISAHPLEEFRNVSADSVNEEKFSEQLPIPEELLPPISASTYVFCRVDYLQAELWSYQDFVTGKARYWY